MKAIVGLIGICMVGFAAGTLLVSLKVGLCAAIGVGGLGLVIDALRK